MKISNSYIDLTQFGKYFFFNGNIKRLVKKEVEEFHTSVTRVIFLSKSVRLYIHQTLPTLPMRVKEPDDIYWKKFVIMINSLMGQRKSGLILAMII